MVAVAMSINGVALKGRLLPHSHDMFFVIFCHYDSDFACKDFAYTYFHRNYRYCCCCPVATIILAINILILFGCFWLPLDTPLDNKPGPGASCSMCQGEQIIFSAATMEASHRELLISALTYDGWWWWVMVIRFSMPNQCFLNGHHPTMINHQIIIIDSKLIDSWWCFWCGVIDSDEILIINAVVIVVTSGGHGYATQVVGTGERWCGCQGSVCTCMITCI